MRSPFQVLIIPFRQTAAGAEYAVLKRADLGWWQFVSGGGEGDETPIQAAERETAEELGISAQGMLLRLDSMATVPGEAFSASRQWGGDIYVIPEYCFAIDVGRQQVTISSEHTEIRWAPYDEAGKMLRWDGNRNALWELRERLRRGSKHDSV